MAMTITPLFPVIAVECSGIDIGRTLTKDEAEAIDAGMDRYGVLIFRRAFTKNFGELEPPDTQIRSPEAQAVGV